MLSRSCRFHRISFLLLALVALSVTLAACSGPAGNEPAATPTATIVAATPTAAPATAANAPPTATATATTTPSSTATSTTAAVTPTPTIEPTVTATTASPTTAVTSLPQGGAELRIAGKAVLGVVAGDAEGRVLYAVTEFGIARSGDGGRNWTAAGDVPQGVMLAALNNPDVLYAGARQACARGDGGGPFTRSTDGGVTWETFPGGQDVQPLLVEAGVNSKVLGTRCALVVSTNGGQSFVAVPGVENYDISAAAVDGAALNDEVVVLGTSEGGTSLLWALDVSNFGAPVVARELTRFFGAGAVAWTGGRLVLATPTGVGVSDDGGASWAWSRAGLEDVTFSVDPLTQAIPDAEQSRDARFTVARIDPTDTDRIWVGGPLGAWRSADGGKTWTQLGDDSLVDTLVVSSAAGRVFVSSDGGTRMWSLDGG